MRLSIPASLEVRSALRAKRLKITPTTEVQSRVTSRWDLQQSKSFTSTAITRFKNSNRRSNGKATSITDRTNEPLNKALSFPCLDAVENRTSQLSTSNNSNNGRRSGSNSISRTNNTSTGPEPSYTTGKHQTFKSTEPLLLDWGGILPSYEIAYETWGRLNANHSNAILLHTGLSASSHAHGTPANPKPGWWEKFIGPGKALDTDRYFIICTNVLGGCYGSTGPSSIDPMNGEYYGTRFPILTLDDMVRAQFQLLDHLEINCLHASVGSSMGGMQSLAAGVMFPDRLKKLVTISSCARSHPSSIAMRHVQRQVLMTDPNWQRGFYYKGIPPHAGMKLARELATITYRSGPEWEQRFGRRRAESSLPPALCPDFLVETYLDHAGEKWCLEYDANSLLYISKAMDLFDLGQEQKSRVEKLRQANTWKLAALSGEGAVEQRGYDDGAIESSRNNNNQNNDNYNNNNNDNNNTKSNTNSFDTHTTESNPDPTFSSSSFPSSSSFQSPSEDLTSGLSPLSATPTLVLGVASDILFPAWQQREIADTLRRAGNRTVTHIELGQDRSVYGHDTFLLDTYGVGGSVGEFLG